MSDTPRIYVASLSDYNAGRLHGRWIEAIYGVDSIHEEIEDMLKESPEPVAEEWAIHDYEGFAGLSLHEHEDLESVATAAELIDDYGPVAAGVIDHVGGLEWLAEARLVLEDQSAGAAESLEGWVEQYLDDTGALEKVPSNLRYYFDFEKYARDLELGGEIFTIEVDQEVHVFWTR